MITRLKIPIEIYNKDPETIIQQMIGLNSKLVNFNRLSIITNDSSYLIDVKYLPQIINKLIILQTKDLRFDEKNMRHIFLYNNQLVQINKLPNPLPEKLPVKIFKIQKPKDDIKYNAIIYKQMFTSLLTPLKNDVALNGEKSDVTLNGEKNDVKMKNDVKLSGGDVLKIGKVLNRDKQIREYEKRIKTIALFNKISSLKYFDKVNFDNQDSNAYLIDYHILPDHEITGILYTVSDRVNDPNMILYYNDITETISKRNIQSIKAIMSNDIEQYEQIKSLET